MPRHPPCALSSLIYQRLSIACAVAAPTHEGSTYAAQMLASTVQFSRYGRCRAVIRACRLEVSEQFAGRTAPVAEVTRRAASRVAVRPECPEPSGPNSVPRRFPLPTFHSAEAVVLVRQGGRAPNRECSTHELPGGTIAHRGLLDTAFAAPAAP